jgi:hypothetical protein
MKPPFPDLSDDVDLEIRKEGRLCPSSDISGQAETPDIARQIALAPLTDKQKRDAESARRYRQRRTRKQGLYRVVAHKMRTIDLLVREGHLTDGVEHSHGMIEQALTNYIDKKNRQC